MPMDATSLAAGIGVGLDNVVFSPEVQNLPRKISLVGTFNPANTSIVPEVPVRVYSPEQVAADSGQGYMAHRLAKAAFKGSQGIETWITYQDEVGGAVAATGSVTFSGTGILGGTLYGYIAGDSVQTIVTAGMTPAQVATAFIAAVNADADLPVTALVDGVTAAKANLTSKSKGPWGNDIKITFNEGVNESLPLNLVTTVVAMSAGAGIPDIDDAIESWGTGDTANEKFFTDCADGYGLDSTTIGKISTYNGEGDDYTGCYRKIVSRPMRWIHGDTVAATAGLNALIVISDANKLDRTNGIISVPGSPNHPAEIAALACGIMARINQAVVAQHYVGTPLPGIIPGAPADRWTSEYDNRDLAVKSGISPTHIDDGAVYMQNMVTFYRPSSVPTSSNSYRSMRNIAILQNIVANIRQTFKSDEWKGISIVKDISRVTVTADAVKVRSISYVVATLIQLAKQFEGKAWLYSADYTIKQLQIAGAVSIRSGGIGFDNLMKVVLSGEGGIFDTTVQHDISLTVAL